MLKRAPAVGFRAHERPATTLGLVAVAATVFWPVGSLNLGAVVICIWKIAIDNQSQRFGAQIT